MQLRSVTLTVALAAAAFAGAACSATPRPRLATDPPPPHIRSVQIEPVRVLTLMEEQRVIVERKNGSRMLLQLGNGCLQVLPEAFELPKIAAGIESPGDQFAGTGAKLVFPEKRGLFDSNGNAFELEISGFESPGRVLRHSPKRVFQRRIASKTSACVTSRSIPKRESTGQIAGAPQ